KIGVQAKSSVTINLQLIGRITSGELSKDVLRLPVRVTEVRLANGLFSSLLVKTLLGDWLKPDTWNDELPAIELPLEFSQALQMPASHFEVAGEMPMEISTPPLDSLMKFSITSFLVLNRRVVLSMQLERSAANGLQSSYGGAMDNDPL